LKLNKNKIKIKKIDKGKEGNLGDSQNVMSNRMPSEISKLIKIGTVNNKKNNKYFFSFVLVKVEDGLYVALILIILKLVLNFKNKTGYGI